ASTRDCASGSLATRPISTPIRRVRFVCACVASGQAMTVPLTSVIKSRRLRAGMGSPHPVQPVSPSAYHGGNGRALWAILNRSESGRQVPVPLGGRDPAQCLIQRSAASGVRPSLECFRRTDASAPPAESLPTPKNIFLQKRLSHKGYPLYRTEPFLDMFLSEGA